MPREISHNVLKKLRRVAGASRLPAEPKQGGETPPATIFSDKEHSIDDHGLVSVLKQIHDVLDSVVLAADALEEASLERLVSFNHERAEKEKNGKVRYLRPDFQNPDGMNRPQPLLSLSIQTAINGVFQFRERAVFRVG